MSDVTLCIIIVIITILWLLIGTLLSYTMSPIKKIYMMICILSTLLFIIMIMLFIFTM